MPSSNSTSSISANAASFFDASNNNNNKTPTLFDQDYFTSATTPITTGHYKIPASTSLHEIKSSDMSLSHVGGGGGGIHPLVTNIVSSSHTAAAGNLMSTPVKITSVGGRFDGSDSKSERKTTGYATKSGATGGGGGGGISNMSFDDY